MLEQDLVARLGATHERAQPPLHAEIRNLSSAFPARHGRLIDTKLFSERILFDGAQTAEAPNLRPPLVAVAGYAHICVIAPPESAKYLFANSVRFQALRGQTDMRDTSQNLHKSGAPRRAGRGARVAAGEHREQVATAIHHCLKYLSHDARRNGMAQTASILDMAAHLAVDEARAARARS
jgi:hypothetical protein